MIITDPERLILLNQYAILEFLSRARPEVAVQGHTVRHDPDQYKWYQEVLRGGYDVLLTEISQNIYEPMLSSHDQVEILDILDMWADLQRSWNRLESKSGLMESDVEFPGWDGNSLKGELGFATTFCFRHDEAFPDKPDRFADIKPSPAYNSHWPVMDMYRSMLRVYKPIREQRLKSSWGPMSLEELQAVLAAKTLPENSG